MCGIGGIWGDPAEPRLRTIARTLSHRGPDEQGVWSDAQSGIGLAHARLSIIDLQTGQQPICNEDGRVVMVFNGEIYNYRELREELCARGHRFRTTSDSEVIVHLYEDEGLEAVTRLRGMFAIALWDADRRQLVLARDRVGKKPLYYCQSAGEFVFASEIKGVVAVARIAAELNRQALADYLGWGDIHPPETIYREVRSVLPSRILVVRDREVVDERTYWQLAFEPKLRLGSEEAVEQTNELLREAVRLRLRSDVPVGAFLSGGIDSGIVTAMAAQQYAGKLITVTIGVEDGRFDERPLARQVAERYETDHHEVLIRPDVARDLPTIAANYDQPFGDSSAVPSYYVAQAARRFVKVVLNGDGGDETFAGYRHFLAGRLSGKLHWADRPACRGLWRLLSGALPVPRSFRTKYAFAHRLVRGMGLAPAERYLAWTVDGLTEPEKRWLCGTAGRADGHGMPGPSACWLDGTAPASRLSQGPLDTFRRCGALDRMLGTGFHTWLPASLLVKMDIACMAHGLEARSPLLDHVLIDSVARFPESVKLPGMQTKPLLRRLSQRYLPADVQTAPKQGFEIPVAAWLRGPLKPVCEDLMLSRDGLLLELFDRAALEKLIRGQVGMEPGRWGRRVWWLLMLSVWDRCVRVRGHGDARPGSAAGGVVPRIRDGM